LCANVQVPGLAGAGYLICAGREFGWPGQGIPAAGQGIRLRKHEADKSAASIGNTLSRVSFQQAVLPELGRERHRGASLVLIKRELWYCMS